jgi:3-oxoacyl-[acyl-carrier-protein] synthase-3
MSTIKFKNIGIQAIAACIPKKIESNRNLGYLIPNKNDIERLIQSTSIEERRIASNNICASDLCEKAAKKLLEDNNIILNNIDALIFVSQTPDYHQPATAMSLQNKLGLPKSTLSFDINLACSGYIYGLSTAFAYAQVEGINNVLLLAGDTLSKTISPQDKSTVPLFGDAGTATLIEKGSYPDSFFTLNSDGGEAGIINIPCGGYRQPSTSKGFDDVVDRDGNVRNGEQLHMDGAEVFNFGLREVPKDIKNLLAFAGETIESIDLII